MAPSGANWIEGRASRAGETTFEAVDPSTGRTMGPAIAEATTDEVDCALTAAAGALDALGRVGPEARASFLDAIADRIMALGDALIDRAGRETGLPAARLTAERGRTAGQLKLFANVVREGSWVAARIDTALLDRQPQPKPDLRRMLVPIGPVVVFAASNFPLAFSVAGGDTASALAAGNPVVVKAHPAHPGVCDLVGGAIRAAAEATGMPAGVFALVHGAGHAVGRALVSHALTEAVGFTGSLRGGRALLDLAAARPRPIPVYAEMGSVNPVFVLPGALAERGAALAEALLQSVTLGVGQFCTKPGLIFATEGAPLAAFASALSERVAACPPGTMLYGALRENFVSGIERLLAIPGVSLAARCDVDASATQVAPVVLRTDASTFLGDPRLAEEVFGPGVVLVSCHSADDFVAIARRMDGHLTATVQGSADDLAAHGDLIAALRRKVGRLIFNGVPTGVEVCPSMHHGGPYPATSDGRTTSVGTAAIERFARPVCFQDFPDVALPDPLRDANPRRLWRLVNNSWTRDGI